VCLPRRSGLALTGCGLLVLFHVCLFLLLTSLLLPPRLPSLLLLFFSGLLRLCVYPTLLAVFSSRLLAKDHVVVLFSLSSMRLYQDQTILHDELLIFRDVHLFQLPHLL
jgi:hypothetical protein